MDIKIALAILFTLKLQYAESQPDLCERQNLCKRCSPKVFSFYRCNDGACWDSEVCVDGFCCIRDSLGITSGPIFTSAPGTSSRLCPDNSQPLSNQDCFTDGSCTFLGGVCVMNRCCATCNTRRTAVLSGRDMNAYVPVCSLDGRNYMPRQCRNDADCWCTNSFGMEIAGTRPSGTNCAEHRRLHEAQYPPNVDCSTRTHNTQIYACPNVNSLAQNLDHQCTCDADCTGGLYVKCCLTSVGRRCFDTGNVPARITPPSSLTTNTALTTTISPPFTVPSSVATVKPGECPPVSTSRTTGINLPNFCSIDLDCPDTQKCCLGAFNNRRCMSPSNGGTPGPPNIGGSEQCGYNEVFTSCAEKCQPHCGNVNRLPCPTFGCVSGCVCKPGFIRSHEFLGAQCISPLSCTGVSPVTSEPPCNGDAHRSYKTCGTACPPSCNVRTTVCTLNCVAGCFCNPPYILEDGNNPASQCVLPENCPAQTCEDPRKTFMRCGPTCSPSCSNPTCTTSRPTLSPQSSTTKSGANNRNVCTVGCFCQPPYVLLDENDPESRCVPRAHCERQCTDARKEFLVCGPQCPPACDDPNPSGCSTTCRRGCFCRQPYILADANNFESDCVLREACSGDRRCNDPNKEWQNCASACPIGCDNLAPSTSFCVPCQSGCFCKSGFVFRNASDWENSACIPRNQCDTSGGTGVAPQGGNGPTYNVCPRDTVDTPGAFCSLDSQCERGRKCCPIVNAIGTSAVNRRCICTDPNEVFSQCQRSLCANGREATCATLRSCSNNLTPLATCQLGCFCRAGYVRQSENVGAPCVSVSACTEATPSVYYARAAILPAFSQLNSQISGTIDLQQTLFNGLLRVSGQVNGLPVGEHAVALMEYGDVSQNCRNLGGHFNPTGSVHGAPSTSTANSHAGDLGNILATGFGSNTLARMDVTSSRLRLSNNDGGVLGRAIAIYANRDDFGLGGTQNSAVNGNAGDIIACGVIVAVKN